MKITGNICLTTGVRRATLEIQGDRIFSITPALDRGSDLLLTEGQILVPGFIDPQINGGFGKEFKTDPESVSHVSERIVEFGTTAILPTITTKQQGTYASHLKALEENSAAGARILGFHIEGPALSEAKRGAHPKEWLVTPDQVDIQELLRPSVRILTLAPELPGGWELARLAIMRGVRVGIGHSTASYEEVLQNFDPTMMHVVHVYNGMPEMSGRQPGLVGFALDQTGFPASVIADLVHVHAAALRVLWKARQGQRLFAVSDGSAVLGLDIGRHRIGSREIERRVDRAVIANTETLVGSVLTMNVAARNIRSVTECTLSEAVNFVSMNSAQYLGLEADLGSIEVGKLADLCIIDNDFQVYKTFVGGRIAFDRSTPK